MNSIDILLGVLLILALIQGLRKGFIIELASLAGIIIGVLGAVYYSYFIGDLLMEYTSWKEQTIQILAFACTFIAILLLVALLARILTKIVGFVALGLLNRLLGGAFGVLKIAFLTSVAFMLLNAMALEPSFLSEEKKETSLLYTPVASLAPMVLPRFFDEAKIYIEEDAEEKENIE